MKNNFLSENKSSQRFVTSSKTLVIPNYQNTKKHPISSLSFFEKFDRRFQRTCSSTNLAPIPLNRIVQVKFPYTWQVTNDRGGCSAIINRLKNPLLLRQSGIPFFLPLLLSFPVSVTPRRGNKCTWELTMQKKKNETRRNLAAGNLNVNSRQRRVACCYGSRNEDLHTRKAPWLRMKGTGGCLCRERARPMFDSADTRNDHYGFKRFSIQIPRPEPFDDLKCNDFPDRAFRQEGRGVHTWRFRATC